MKKGEGSKVFGCSDDLIEFRGDVYGETGGGSKPALLVFSDGTILTARYGKDEAPGVWGLSLVKQGSLFQGIVPCVDENADPYSDVATFAPGLAWAYAATEWERVH